MDLIFKVDDEEFLFVAEKEGINRGMLFLIQENRLVTYSYVRILKMGDIWEILPALGEVKPSEVRGITVQEDLRSFLQNPPAFLPFRGGEGNLLTLGWEHLTSEELESPVNASSRFLLITEEEDRLEAGKGLIWKFKEKIRPGLLKMALVVLGEDLEIPVESSPAPEEARPKEKPAGSEKEGRRDDQEIPKEGQDGKGEKVRPVWTLSEKRLAWVKRTVYDRLGEKNFQRRYSTLWKVYDRAGLTQMTWKEVETGLTLLDMDETISAEEVEEILRGMDLEKYGRFWANRIPGEVNYRTLYEILSAQIGEHFATLFLLSLDRLREGKGKVEPLPSAQSPAKKPSPEKTSGTPTVGIRTLKPPTVFVKKGPGGFRLEVSGKRGKVLGENGQEAVQCWGEDTGIAVGKTQFWTYWTVRKGDVTLRLADGPFPLGKVRGFHGEVLTVLWHGGPWVIGQKPMEVEETHVQTGDQEFLVFLHRRGRPIAAFWMRPRPGGYVVETKGRLRAKNVEISQEGLLFWRDGQGGKVVTRNRAFTWSGEEISLRIKRRLNFPLLGDLLVPDEKLGEGEGMELEGGFVAESPWGPVEITGDEIRAGGKRIRLH